MKRGLFLRTFITDIYRALSSVKFPVAVALTVAVLILSAFEDIALNSDVLYVFSIVMYGMPSLLILITAVFVYGDSFCLDAEHRYLHNIVLRSGLRNYVVSKVLVIFISSVLTVCLGIVIYTSALRLFMPWTGTESNQFESLMRSGGLRFFLKRHMFPAYFFLYGLQYGFMAGVLSALSAYISLFAKNRTLVLAAPFICYYLIERVIYFVIFSPSYVFSAAHNVMHDDFLSFMLAVVVSAVCLAVIMFLCEKKIRKDYMS